jgi:tetratricopeptide (TPR) repeat protein
MSKREPQAKEVLDRVLARNPRDPEALFYSAVLLVNTRGDLEKAIVNLQAVRDMVPDNIDARKLLVDVYLRRNRLEAGIEEMENILRIEPEDKFTRIKLVETYLASNPPRTVDAERLCREASTVTSLSNDADMKHAYARTLLIKGDIAGSVAMINEARKIDPNNLPLMDTFFRIMMGAKQYQGVVAEATKLLEKHPDKPWLYGTRAAGYAKLKQPDKALADFEQGYNVATEKGDDFGANNIIQGMMLEISPEQAVAFLKPRVQGNPSRMFMLSQVYIRAGKIDDAIKSAEDALAARDKLKPNQVPQVMDFLGTAFLQQNPPNVTKAADMYEQLLKIQPGNFRALNNMAYLKMLPQSGAAPKDALAYSQRAFDEMIKANTYEAEIADTHGWVLIEAGSLDQGLVVLRDAVNRRPNLIEGWYHLALGHHKKGELREADDSLRRAEELLDASRKKGMTVDPQIESKIKELRVQMPPATSASFPPPGDPGAGSVVPAAAPAGPGGR